MPLRRCAQRAFEHEGAAMSTNQPAADNKKVTTIVIDNPDDFKGTLKRIVARDQTIGTTF
jgi:hypothetical protein